jgi:hypothetical protein
VPIARRTPYGKVNKYLPEFRQMMAMCDSVDCHKYMIIMATPAGAPLFNKLSYLEIKWDRAGFVAYLTFSE